MRTSHFRICKMADSTTFRFYCDFCQLGFNFASKYDGHLRSSHHRALEAILETDQSYETEADPPSVTTTEDHSLRGLDTMDSNLMSDDDLAATNVQSDLAVDEIMRLVHNDQSDSLSENEPGIDEQGDIEALLTSLPEGNDYSPFQSKIHALSYMLLNSPRPMGEANLRFIFFLMRQLDCSVPSLSTMKSIRLPGFTPPTKHFSVGGIPFFVNSAQDIIRKCIGTPDIASAIARYPTVKDTVLTEMFHGKRWLEDPRFLSPMVSMASGSVYVRDFVRFNVEGAWKLGCILSFFHKEGVVGIYAAIQCLELDGHGIYTLRDIVSVPVACIAEATSPPSILRHGNVNSLLTVQEYSSYTSCHRLKAVAKDLPVLMLPLILYTDDTSGNKSKQWNKFDSWCLKLASLPNRDNQNLHNIHLLCTSNKVDCIEMSPPIVNELKQLERDGIEVYDAHLQTKVLVVAPVICIICDNPRASEVTNNLGPSSRMFCRMCMADRDNDPATLGTIRTKDQTLAQMDNIHSQQTTRLKAALRTQYGVKETPNALLELPLDLHRSTPVETLHTILLGPYKYLLRILMGHLTTAQKEELQARLATFDFSGLEYKMSYNLIRHFRSFVGRDFKAIAQVALFLLGPYMSSQEKEVWLALGKVFRIAYCYKLKITKVDEMQKICEEFVRAVNDHFPELKKKVKIHLLLHLTQSMIDFGPTSTFNTERCETYNSLIRARNIYANRLAPSRDIAQAFATLQHLRFICSGGSLDGSSMCGEDLCEMYHLPSVQSFLNGIPSSTLLSHKHIYQSGVLRKVARTMIQLQDLPISVRGVGKVMVHQLQQDSNYTLLLMSIPISTCIFQAQSLIGSLNHELVKVGDSIQFSAVQNEVDYGILTACFKVHGTDHQCCIVQVFESMDSFGTPLTNDYDCPLLSLSSLFRCVLSTSIMQSVSVMHECTSTCVVKQVNSPVQVERLSISSPKYILVHDFCNNNLYSLNTYCMHSCD